MARLYLAIDVTRNVFAFLRQSDVQLLFPKRLFGTSQISPNPSESNQVSSHGELFILQTSEAAPGSVAWV
jgi:hypothetical protein